MSHRSQAVEAPDLQADLERLPIGMVSLAPTAVARREAGGITIGGKVTSTE